MLQATFQAYIAGCSAEVIGWNAVMQVKLHDQMVFFGFTVYKSILLQAHLYLHVYFCKNDPFSFKAISLQWSAATCGSGAMGVMK